MTVETATYIAQLQPTLPPRSDLEVEGADHLRLIKSTLQACFPNAQKLFNFIVTAKQAANYAVVFPSDMNSYQLMDATLAPRTITLPIPSGVHADGWKMWIMKFDSTLNAITVGGNGNLINGLANYLLTYQYQILEVCWSVAASAWYASDSFSAQPPGASSFATGYTLLATDQRRFIEMDATGAARVVTLPTGANALLSSFRVTVMKIDSSINPVTFTPQSGTVNGLANLSLYGQFDTANLYWDGSTWRAALSIQDSMPVGIQGSTMLVTSPGPKWLPMNGVNFSRTAYAPLFTAWSTNFGLGDGSTTAGMPDVRGYFPRFWNNGAGNDPDAATRTNRGDATTGDTPGTKQAHALQSHIHSTPVGSTSGVQGGVAGGLATVGPTNSGAPITGNVATETRALNIYLAAYVKALP